LRPPARRSTTPSGATWGGETILFLPAYADSWCSYNRVLPLLPALDHADAWTSAATVTPSVRPVGRPRIQRSTILAGGAP